MRNRLIFGITFDAYEDNLAENKLTTTTTNSISSNLNYRHSFKYPSLSLGIKNFSRKGEDTEIVDNNTFTLSVGSNYSFLLGQTRNVLNVNFVNTNHADNVYPTADFDNFSFLFGSTSIFDNLPMTISMGVGYNQNKGEIVTTSFNTFSLRGSYQFLDSKLIAKLGTNMINGSRDDDKLASTKLKVETGADYRWTKERILGMSLGFVNYSDSENPNTEYNEAILRFYASQRF